MIVDLFLYPKINLTPQSNVLFYSVKVNRIKQSLEIKTEIADNLLHINAEKTCLV